MDITKELAACYENLTAAQERCNTLIDEARTERVKAQLAESAEMYWRLRSFQLTEEIMRLKENTK